MRINLKQIKHSKELIETINTLKLSNDIKIIETVSSPTQIITLSHIPLKSKIVRVDINGIFYEENIDFVIDYSIGRLYWSNNDFNIDFNDEIRIHYYVLMDNFIKPNKKVMVGGGNLHSYALIDDTLYSFGLNNESLVNFNNSNTEDIYSTPIEVEGVGKILDLCGSINHTVILNENNELYSWGSNSVGQLGIGSTEESSGINRIELENIIKIECGDFFNLALDINGNVYSWGYNSCGQLGTGDTENRDKPYKIHQLSEIKDIMCDGNYAMAISKNNELWVWGNNYYGQLGLGHNDNVITPTRSYFTNINQVYPGYDSLFVIDNDQQLWCAGDNLYGQLGINSNILNINKPTKVKDISNVISISRSNYHIVALTSNNILYSWGNNNYGQLGQGHTNNLNIPTHINGLFNIIEVAATNDCTYALRNDGQVFSFGNNDKGQLGIPNVPSISTPTNINLKEKVLKISSGYDYAFAIGNENVYAWGSNEYGQLGIGTLSDCFEPSRVILN